MATQLLGESQGGGYIIALMLDLNAETFWNNMMPMEQQLGEEQVRIGKQCVALNLKKEMLGKVSFLM
jgi:hypothetical protein